MRHPSIIRRICLEADGEDVVRVISGHVQILRSCFIMLEMEGCKLELWHVLGALESEAMKLFARIRINIQVGHGSILSSTRPEPQ